MRWAAPGLVAAMEAASRRRLAAGWLWDRRGLEPITAPVSHTLALWAVDHLTPEAPRLVVM